MEAGSGLGMRLYTSKVKCRQPGLTVSLAASPILLCVSIHKDSFCPFDHVLKDKAGVILHSFTSYARTLFRSHHLFRSVLHRGEECRESGRELRLPLLPLIRSNTQRLVPCQREREDQGPEED